MTLREIIDWIVTYWENYYFAITNDNILDWNLSYIAWTFFGGIVVLGVFGLVLEVVLSVFTKLKLPQWPDENAKEAPVKPAPTEHRGVLRQLMELLGTLALIPLVLLILGLIAAVFDVLFK
ncbi:MAG: hypothetical protein IKD58_09155 [Loktanella sp.]|nr:hypothetical protein [Loktanella sp.]